MLTSYCSRRGLILKCKYHSILHVSRANSNVNDAGLNDGEKASGTQLHLCRLCHLEEKPEIKLQNVAEFLFHSPLSCQQHRSAELNIDQ